MNAANTLITTDPSARPRATSGLAVLYSSSAISPELGSGELESMAPATDRELRAEYEVSLVLRSRPGALGQMSRSQILEKAPASVHNEHSPDWSETETTAFDDASADDENHDMVCDATIVG